MKKQTGSFCLSLWVGLSLFWTTQARGQGNAWQAVAAFPNLTFDDATMLVAEPRTNRLYVCGREGVIWFFANDPNTTTRTVFLDLSAQTQGWETCGLLGLAFHPEYGLPGSTNRGYVYVYYSYNPNPVPGPNPPPMTTPTYDRLSRFTVPDGSLVADPNSELVLVNQWDPHIWLEGGGIFFGSDGFLYFSNGDEGAEDDAYNAAQTLTGGLFSGLFRIDVNSDPSRSHPIRRQPLSYGSGNPPSSTANYYVPNDNPFLDPSGGVLEEYYALGFRNPYRATFDAATGRIWLADVGGSQREEVDLIVKGGNYQWAYMEGTVAGPKAKPSPIIGTDQPPVYDYPHTLGNNSVIGGYVYRGAQYASELGGRYLFGDWGSDRIWAMTYDGINPTVVTQLCTLPPTIAYAGISSFGLDQNNELYVSRIGLGQNLYRLVLTNATPPAPLPAPWVNQDIGSVGLTGSASYTNGVFVVSGSGFDIWDPRDAFQFVYQPWVGDGEIIAQVTGLLETDGYAKAGVMFREVLLGGSRHALMLVTASRGTGFQRRLDPDGTTTWTASTSDTVPYWLRLTRSGNLFSAYGSTDGISWTLAGSDTITMSNAVYVGLAVTSHNDSQLTTSTLDNVSVSSPVPQLSLSRYDASGRMLLRIPGNLGRSYIVQFSSNLLNWTNLATVTNTGPAVSFIDNGTTNQTRRFYRTVLVN